MIRLFCLCFLFFFPDLPQPLDVRNLHHRAAHRHGPDGLVAFLRIRRNAQEEISPRALVASRVFLRKPSKPIVKARPRAIRFMVLDFAVMVALRRVGDELTGTDSRSVMLTEPGSVDKKKIDCVEGRTISCGAFQSNRRHVVGPDAPRQGAGRLTHTG